MSIGALFGCGHRERRNDQRRAGIEHQFSGELFGVFAEEELAKCALAPHQEHNGTASAIVLDGFYGFFWWMAPRNVLYFDNGLKLNKNPRGWLLHDINCRCGNFSKIVGESWRMVGRRRCISHISQGSTPYYLLIFPDYSFPWIIGKYFTADEIWQ